MPAFNIELYAVHVIIEHDDAVSGTRKIEKCVRVREKVDGESAVEIPSTSTVRVRQKVAGDAPVPATTTGTAPITEKVTPPEAT